MKRLFGLNILLNNDNTAIHIATGGWCTAGAKTEAVEPAV